MLNIENFLLIVNTSSLNGNKVSTRKFETLWTKHRSLYGLLIMLMQFNIPLISSYHRLGIRISRYRLQWFIRQDSSVTKHKTGMPCYWKVEFKCTSNWWNWIQLRTVTSVLIQKIASKSVHSFSNYLSQIVLKWVLWNVVHYSKFVSFWSSQRRKKETRVE